MSDLGIFYWIILLCSSEIWRNRGSKFRVCAEMKLIQSIQYTTVPGHPYLPIDDVQMISRVNSKEPHVEHEEALRRSKKVGAGQGMAVKF